MSTQSPPTLHLGLLPKAQQALFRRLTFTRDRFVLHGGTAVALHAGHRSSVDFDLFSSDALPEVDKQQLIASLSLPKDAPRLQNESNTLTVLVPFGGAANSVKVSFFGDLDKPRFASPVAADVGPRVASTIDLAGFKLAVCHNRNLEDDLADIAALLRLGETLERAVAVMEALYPGQAPPHHAIASVAWFDRTPSPTGALTNAAKQQLARAVAAYRAPVRNLLPQAQRLSAPGYEPARLPSLTNA